MVKVSLLKSCIWLIHILDTHYKMENCRNKEVTAILRHLSTIRLQETSEHHLCQLPAQNRATSNQFPVRPTVQTVFHALHCSLIKPIQFGCQGIKGDLVSKYTVSSVLHLSINTVSSLITESNQVSNAWSVIGKSRLLAITFLSLVWPELAYSLKQKFCSQSSRNMVRLTSKLVFKHGRKVWVFMGLSITSSNGPDLLKLIKARSVSTLTGISIHASTFYAPPFCSWATEGPHSTLWTSQFTALVPDVHLSSYISLLKFWAQLMLWIFFLLEVPWKAWEGWRHWFLQCIAFLKWYWREFLRN